jgi:hypothetical protein
VTDDDWLIALLRVGKIKRFACPTQAFAAQDWVCFPHIAVYYKCALLSCHKSPYSATNDELD